MKRKSLIDWAMDAVAGIAFLALAAICVQSQMARADIPEGVTLRQVQTRANVVNVTSFILYASSTARDSFVTTCCGDTAASGDTIFGDTTCCDTIVAGLDTTLTEDTSQAVILGDAHRASISYQITHVDRDGVDINCDTCTNGRFVYQWSNDQVYWFSKDSTGAVTDTLAHMDTLIVRPFAYVRAIFRLTDPPNWVDDTTNESTLGSGREWIVGQGSIQPFYWPEKGLKGR